MLQSEEGKKLQKVAEDEVGFAFKIDLLRINNWSHLREYPPGHTYHQIDPVRYKKNKNLSHLREYPPPGHHTTANNASTLWETNWRHPLWGKLLNIRFCFEA